MKLFAQLLLLSPLCIWPTALAQDAAPPQPTRQEAEQLVQDGDRLADQADYSGALEKYTQAYHEVVSRIRGQQFTKEVLPKLLTRTELGEEMLRVMDREYDQAEWALIDASYKVFGLIPKDMSSKEIMAKLLTEEVAGFYDPESKQMVLIREEGAKQSPGFFERLLGAKSAFDKQEQKTTLAHEMTHALQDQLYDLRKLQKLIEKDDDMSLAFSALVEGDATLLMMAEMDGGSDITELDPEVIRSTFSLMSFMLPVSGGATYRKAPAIFRDSLIFPYFQGMVFAVSVTGKRGWPAMHKAYESLPASTEQILHPDKYNLSPRDEPQRVIIPDLSSALSGDWQHLGGNCLGEYQTSILLKKLRSAKRASEGWDGDRYEVFQKADGRLGVVFVSIWDSKTDAEEFAKSYRQLRKVGTVTAEPNENSPAEESTPTVQEKPQQAKPDDPAKQSDAAEIVLGSQVLVEVHDDCVWVIEGFHADETKALRGLLETTRYEPKPFPEH